MPPWTSAYRLQLSGHFQRLVSDLPDRLDRVSPGRVAPAVDDITIGAGRKLRAAVLFFDIRGFTSMTGSPDDDSLTRTLTMLDCVIPMVMQVVRDHGGYVEKNTGDGVMAILGADSTDAEAADAALDTALTIFYVLQNLVNPYLASIGIARVDARIGIDLGRLLLARIGIPSGSARHQSNFLTAVGPAANLACRLQQMADTNQIWVGDLIKRSATGRFDWLFREVTPSDWTWVYDHNRARYPAWHYNDSRSWPDLSLGELLRGLYRT